MSTHSDDDDKPKMVRRSQVTMRIPPHVHRNIYAGLVQFKLLDPKDVKVIKPSRDLSLEKSRLKGQKKTTKSPDRSKK